jgi:chaperone BCS1
MFHHPIEDELTLEYVLNILDGIVENHEAIIVFTTNHLEEIDPALIRPGRVDYKLELKNATVNTIKEMVSKKYKLRELTDYNEYFMKMSDYVLSPAEVQNEIFMRDDVLDCLNNLLCKYNSKTCE